MGTITWLHISDLHFEASQVYNANIVLHALLRDISECIKRDSLHPDFVAVTGDIAFSGKPAEYRLAQQFFDDLLQTTGLAKDDLFLVPGNHDVNRSLVSIGALAIGNSLQDRDRVNSLLTSAADRQLMMARFEGYAAFCNDYLGGRLHFDDTDFFYAKPVAHSSHQIAILGLNTAWLSASDADAATRLVLGEYQIRTALERTKADLKIALLHHPLDCLREFDRSDAQALLCRECPFILHGHMHQTDVLSFRDPDSNAVLVGAGACYKARNYPNSYNFVQIDPKTGRGAIYLRMYSDRQGGFWTKDTMTYRNVPDGQHDFTFGPELARKPGHRRRRVAVVARAAKAAKVFISYKRHAEPDERLALHFCEALKKRGHSVFIDQTMTIGTKWAREIERQIESSDFMLVLLSDASINSEMVAAEVKCAHDTEQKTGSPRTLPVRVGCTGELPYSLSTYLDALQYALWQSDDDTKTVTEQIISAVEEARNLNESSLLIGTSLAFDLPKPVPHADPRLLDLDAPQGTVRLESKFYIERPGDAVLKREVLNSGTLTYIRAPRQTGKSSLLIRGVRHAREHVMSVAFVDCQFADASHLVDLDAFLRCLADLIARELRVGGVDAAWKPPLAASIKLSNFLEVNVLEPASSPVLLVIDEADRLYGTPFRNDFFGLVRAWYNRAQWDETWKKLRIAMAISTEPYLLIDDIYQSPFNVGTRIELDDFNEHQVADLNRRHGSPLSSLQVHEMVDFLGGHPYLTRKAFYVMLTENGTWPEIAKQAVDEHSPFGDHLRRYLWLLRDKPDLAQAMKRIAKDRTCTDEVTFHRLHAAGLVRRQGSQCLCRCPLYEMFFSKYAK